jgi:hypothetical protein
MRYSDGIGVYNGFCIHIGQVTTPAFEVLDAHFSAVPVPNQYKSKHECNKFISYRFLFVGGLYTYYWRVETQSQCQKVPSCRYAGFQLYTFIRYPKQHCERYVITRLFVHSCHHEHLGISSAKTSR